MRFLRKILFALGLMILLAVLKPLFQRLFPLSNVFHYNLFSVLQMLLLLWAVLTGLLEMVFWKKLRPAASRSRSLLIFLLLVALAETSTRWLLFHPRHIPTGALPAFRLYYDNYQRDIVQFNKKMARYDPNLFYSLIPDNHSLFTNIEFSDSIITDPRGFRTGEQAPDHPAILCLGDSYTFGWGAQQNDCYPQLLQNILHEQVLNTGVPSYGTARELASVKALDKTGLSTMIIQYCYNDAGENQACVDNHFQPVISSAAVYDSAVDMLWWSKIWFPGKYSCTVLKLLLDEKLGLRQKEGLDAPDTPLGNTDKQAENFLAILARSGLDFRKTHIYVFAIGEYETLSNHFLTSLEKKLASPECSALFVQHVHTVHIENKLTKEDYFLLDGHIKASGHKKLARCLADAIRTSQPGPPAISPSDTSFHSRY
jgi:lysophospholipase L1-like esterase